MENSNASKHSNGEKSVVKMKVEFPKIKTKFPLKKEYGRVTVHKEVRNLDDPNVSSKIDEKGEKLTFTRW